jgi:hypothetical protein
LCEEVCGILVFLCAAAKKTEATRSSLERFFGLEVAFEVSDRSVVLRRGEMEGWMAGYLLNEGAGVYSHLVPSARERCKARFVITSWI